MAKHLWQLDGIGYLAKFVCLRCHKYHTKDTDTAECSGPETSNVLGTRYIITEAREPNVTLLDKLQLIWQAYFGFLR